MLYCKRSLLSVRLIRSSFGRYGSDFRLLILTSRRPSASPCSSKLGRDLFISSVPPILKLSTVITETCRTCRRHRGGNESFALYRGLELVWAIGRLMSPDHGFGTSCLLHCGHLIVCANSEDG